MTQLPPLEALATALVGGEGTDYLEVYEALAPFLTFEQYVALGVAIEACPIHKCDVQICLDDGSPCSER